MSTQTLLGKVGPRRLVELSFFFRRDREYLIFEGQRISRREAFNALLSLAAGLQSLGVGNGDRVASLLPACPEAVYCWFLPLFLNIVHVPVNPLLRENELSHILGDSAVKAVITTRSWLGYDYAATLSKIKPDLPNLKYIIIRDIDKQVNQFILPLNDIKRDPKTFQREKFPDNIPFMISYTSGTTRQPKGVVHTQRGVWAIATGPTRARLDRKAWQCALLPFPLYHYAGQFGVSVPLIAGGKVVLVPRPKPQEIFNLIQREKVTQILGAPTLYRLLLSTPNHKDFDFSSMRRVALSTEPCPPELAQALQQRFGCHLENVYGTTETMLISWTGIKDSWQQAARTVGKPVPGAQIKIVDYDNHPVPSGRQGEIIVKTGQMMEGYYGDRKLTDQVFDEDGWFHTGDIGLIDENGYLKIVDRKKDIIIRAGENISPAEIEHFLQTHPLIKSAGVVGVPNKLSGESIQAHILLHPGAELTAPEVLGFCRGKIATFKIPDRIFFVEHLPTTATGKLQRYMLRQDAA